MKFLSVGLMVLLVVVGCEDFASPSGTPPTDPTPSPSDAEFTIQKISGDNQTGAPGLELDDPYVVKVVDEFGGAVADIPVRFRLEPGDGGSLTASTVLTDSMGNAAVTARLPSGVDVSQTTVVESDSADNSVTFTSRTTAFLSGAANIRIISGDQQKGIVRDTLIDPLVVEVSSEDGVALEGVSVKWRVVSGDGGGVVLGTPTRTNSDGLAQNRWRVGNETGVTDSVIAFIEPSNADPDTVMFTASTTGVPDSIVVTQGAIDTDRNLTNPPEIMVGDSVLVEPGHWSDRPFKATVIDSEGRTVRGAVLTWTVTDDLTEEEGAVGAVPEGEGANAVMVVTDDVGSITVWRKATSGMNNDCRNDPNECWIGATLSLDDFPDVTPMTLDARVKR